MFIEFHPDTVLRSSNSRRGTYKHLISENKNVLADGCSIRGLPGSHAACGHNCKLHIYSFIHSFTHSAIQSFLLQMRISSPFLKVIQQFPTSSSSSSRHLYSPFYLSFNNPLQKAVSTQNLTNPVSLLLFISCRTFLCSMTLSNTSSFLTCSVQLIFCILLQHHISKLSRCF